MESAQDVRTPSRRRRERQDQDWERAASTCRLLQARLSRVAEAERLLRPQDGRLPGAGGRNVLNVSYLVAREREHGFVTCAREPSRPGVRIEVHGPWAPYSFADPEPAP
ncbi:hypothetical protein DMB38_31095 [Streptomyces sp. WAC 06738]|uniref:GvpL/GvpF family gas vesicle protein n=1 Tax=Streptomyces sp. WAC 06738 TaxID=2203210 RepID=UPI000F7171BD|nr:GvpL/GvpF family gas vesicle protein [Streptomyces sp. WAC 06738]AZM49632.1 hypothetical protein DMB38_31095 [Streptomyces sp. WAC 06738]